MADIFLSYSHEDQKQAAALVGKLESQRWSVFWDRELRPGLNWSDTIKTELDNARCVVVLWNESSKDSEWVMKEAKMALERDILVPALSQQVTPPAEFSHIQANDLVGWNGDPESHGLKLLVREITNRIGSMTDITLLPIEAALVTGDKKKYDVLGPTVNMTCQVINRAKQGMVLKRLEIVVRRDGEHVFHLSWTLPYEVEGYLHTEVKQEMNIPIAGQSVWEKGIQFRDSQVDRPNIWPAGSYDFDLLGWANRTPGVELADLRSSFRAKVTDDNVAILTEWRNGDDQKWDDLGDKDRAFGIPLTILDIRTGL